MSVPLAIKDTNGFTDVKWTPMVTLSLLLHLVAFIIILYVPQSAPSGLNIDDIIYEVNLIEMPESVLKDKTSGPSVKKATNSSLRKDSQAKRIAAPEQSKKSLTIAKRTVNKKESQPKKPKLSSSQLIDRAISKIEKQVKSENRDNNYVEEAISRLEKKIGPYDSHGENRGATSDGISMRIYKMEVYSRVKSNWAYPEALNSRKKLEAVVGIKIKKDGTIMEEPWLKSSSGDKLFDQSVMKAIEKSIPMPEFHEGYIRSYDEFEFIFTLKDLGN